MREYCCSGLRELGRGDPLPAGTTPLVVFDRALMKPRIFACDDSGDAVLLEAVLEGHPSVVAVFMPEAAPEKTARLAMTGRARPEVTRCTPADLDSITAIDKEEWGAWANTLPLYRQLLDIYPSAMVAARDVRGDIAGFAVGLVCEGGETGWVLSVDVKGAYRGCGVGRALVAGLLDNFRKQGCRNSTAIIAPENIGSISLFESFGFEAQRIEENYFGFGKPQVRYGSRL